MWVSDDGVQHVLSLPEPADVLTRAALVGYLSLCATTDRDDLALALVDRLLALSDDGFEPDTEGLFVERAPAEGLLDGDLTTLAGLDVALAPIDPRWQVDLLLALQDLLDTYHQEVAP